MDFDVHLESIIMAQMTQLARLYVLNFGLFEVHQNGRIIGIQGFLIQTRDGQNILVDTGFPAKYARDLEASSLEDDLGSFGKLLEFSSENLLAGQLAKIGLSVADIDLLILSHSDIDHVGAIADFAGKRIIVGEAERVLERPLYFSDKRPLEWPPADYQLICQDTELLSGLRVLYTPGHSPGHLSLLLDLPKTGKVLLTCDAISRPAELSENLIKGDTLAQAQRLMKLAEDESAWIIYGHSPEQWPTLKKAPEFYD